MTTLLLFKIVWCFSGFLGMLAEFSKLGRGPLYSYKPYINFKDILRFLKGMLFEDQADFISVPLCIGAIISLTFWFMLLGPIIPIGSFFRNKYHTDRQHEI
jgi:hypothetical protein